MQTLSPDGEPLPSSLALAPLHALRLRAPPQALPTPCTFCQACSLHWRRQLRTTWPPCHHRAAHPSPRSSRPSAAQPAQKPVLDLLGRPAPPATKAKSQGPPFLLSGSARRCPGLESPRIAPPSLHPPQPPARASRPSLLQGGPGSRCPRTPAQARLSPAVIKVLPGQPAPVTAAGREIPSRHCETQASVAFRDKSKSP